MKSLIPATIACLAMISLPVVGAEVVRFSDTELGRIPPAWEDLGVQRSSPNWGVDGQGFLRVLWKGEQGVIVYQGKSDGVDEQKESISAQFKKTPDQAVYAAVIGRAQDALNYYALRFEGDSGVELLKVKSGEKEILQSYVTRSRLSEGVLWTLSLSFKGPQITGRVLDSEGIEQARVDGFDKEGFAGGSFGLAASNYAAFKEVEIEGGSKSAAANRGQEKQAQAPLVPSKVLKPVDSPEKLNTNLNDLADSYDVIVAGAGTGGWAAALQASRMGAKVLLLEETDWIGGQMVAAAVSSMDEEGCWEKFPVRERGLYREFHQSMINYYYTLDKDPFRAYYAWPEQLEGGYEPKVARAVLYAFIAEARKAGTLDLAIRSKVVAVKKSGEKVTGVRVEHLTESGEALTRELSSKILVEATEYGDVLPLAGARYRVGTTTSDQIDPSSPVQFHTWVGVIREYPGGVPEHLQIKTPPPGFKAKHGHKLWGATVWGGAVKGVKKPISYRNLLAWRGMADTESTSTGRLTEQRHTQCGLNGGTQDYPVTAASIEDVKLRHQGERDGVYRTLAEIYFLQQELGLPWSVAEDEGYNTPYQRRAMAEREISEEFKSLAVHLPQRAYVREARRGRGLYTLRAEDLTRFEKARLFPTAVAMGDYFMDLDHGPTAHAVEADLSSGTIPKGGGPFQVPFEVFVPEKIDGLVLAEKNISQSRHVNGATRLQPVTILTGQAAGAIAATAVRSKAQPRELTPVAVQSVLLASGANLIQRWYDDVAWGSDLWQATQLLSLYSVLDAPGAFARKREGSMGEGQFWRPEQELSRNEFQTAMKQLGQLAGKPVKTAEGDQPVAWTEVNEAFKQLHKAWNPRTESGSVTRKAFALAAAEVLRNTAKPVLLKEPVQ